jgi:hypothetical protein
MYFPPSRLTPQRKLQSLILITHGLREIIAYHQDWFTSLTVDLL